MKAAILHSLNMPLDVVELETFAPAYGQVLVRVLASGICGAQLQEIRGEKGNARFLPHLLGHEGCGIVEDIGAGVTRVTAGQKCVLHWRKAAGVEADYPRYQSPSGQIIMGGKVTTLSTHAMVSENRLTPVPDEVPPEFAALLGCGLSTALGTIENEAEVKFGDSVMIVGVGGLGANLIRAARLAHAYPIIAVDIHESKRKAAIILGAHEYINSAAQELERLPELLKSYRFDGLDVIIDTAGSGSSMESTLPLLKSGGRFIMVGQPPPGKTVEITNARHLFDGEGKRIIATQGGKFAPHLDIPRYVRLWKRGILRIDDIITHRIALKDINHGLDLVRNGEASRVIVDMSL